METKRFSKKLFDESDRIAKDRYRQYFEVNKPSPELYLIENNKDLDRPDFIVTDGRFIKGYIEVEHRKYWDSPDKYNNQDPKLFSLPSRKIKYVNQVLPVLFVIFNLHFNSFISIKSKDLDTTKQFYQETQFGKEIFLRVEKGKTYFRQFDIKPEGAPQDVTTRQSEEGTTGSHQQIAKAKPEPSTTTGHKVADNRNKKPKEGIGTEVNEKQLPTSQTEWGSLPLLGL